MYGDEANIARRLAARNRVRLSIFNEARECGFADGFGERKPDPRFSMVLPERFGKPSSEYIKSKYPNEDRPDIILSDEGALVDMAMSVMPMEWDDVPVRMDAYRSATERLFPECTHISKNIEKTKHLPCIACYDYMGFAAGGEVYFLVFLTDLPGCELFGCFTCPAWLRGEWETLARQMIRTIKPLENNNEKEEGKNA